LIPQWPGRIDHLIAIIQALILLISHFKATGFDKFIPVKKRESKIPATNTLYALKEYNLFNN